MCSEHTTQETFYDHQSVQPLFLSETHCHTTTTTTTV